MLHTEDAQLQQIQSVAGMQSTRHTGTVKATAGPWCNLICDSQGERDNPNVAWDVIMQDKASLLAFKVDLRRRGTWHAKEATVHTGGL